MPQIFTRIGSLTALGVLVAAAVQAQGSEALKLRFEGARGLALEHWPTEGWTQAQDGRGIELRFPGLAQTIDIESVEPSATDGWLDAIETRSEGSDQILSLTLGCDCSVLLRGDGQTELGIRAIQMTSGARPQKAQSSIKQGPSKTRSPSNSPIPVKRTTRIEADLQGDATIAAQEPVGMDEARERLIAQLRRAADAGLIDLKPDARAELLPAKREEAVVTDPTVDHSHTGSDHTKNGRLQRQVLPDDEEDSRPPKEELGNPQPFEWLHPDLSSQLSTLDAPGALSEARMNYGLTRTQNHVCQDNEALRLPAPTAERNTSSQIAELRSRIAGEFDRADSDVAIELTRLYLAHRMTDEARSVLATFVPKHELRDLLEEVATVLDGRALGPSAILMRSDCTGDHALWHALAQASAGNARGALLAEANAGRAIERIPVQLRDRVASLIGLAAADAGAWDTARRMQSYAQRDNSRRVSRDPATHLLDARIARWDEDTLSAIDSLRSARLIPTEEATAATVMLADMLLSGEAVGRLDAARLEADLGILARQERGTKLGQRAFEQEVQLLQRHDSKDAVIDLLSYGVEAGLISEYDHLSLLTNVVSEPEQTGASRPLALIYLDDPNRFADALARSGFRQALAYSLLETGAPRLAADVLREGDLTDPELSKKLAEAHLEVGDLREVIEIAGALANGPIRDSLTGRAMLAGGQPEQALGHLNRSVAAMSDDDEQRPVVLKALARAASQLDQTATARTALEKKLDAAPSTGEAARLAMMAVDGDSSAIPDQAREILSDHDPTFLETVDTLLLAPEPPDENATAQEVNTYLKNLEAEAEAIRELLEDG